jgi:serine/threonine-protein kinase RsbW|tara:strand:- start:67 stop:450 length:384 start_codon:yes stop_codon:yes gene_type:complete
VVQGTREAFDAVQQEILSSMASLEYSEHDVFSVRIALEEALANALLHGHQGESEHPIEVAWRVNTAKVEITITDQGRGYNPETIPDPTAEENLTLPSGRGLAMMRAFMDHVDVNSQGNVVSMYREKR